MTSDMAVFDLRKPASPDEWRRYHDIRRRSLFDRYLPAIVYDPEHLDERRAENHPLALVCDGRVIGTIRIDELDAERACFRLVAIDEPWRGRGFGAEMLRRAERYAADILGRRDVVLFANRRAYEFYLKQGYAPIAPWGETPLDPQSIPVAKSLRRAAGVPGDTSC